MKLFLRVLSVPLLLAAVYLAFRGSFLLHDGGALIPVLLRFGASALLAVLGAGLVRISRKKRRNDLSGNNPEFHRIRRRL